MQYTFYCLNCEKYFDKFAEIGTLFTPQVKCPNCNTSGSNIRRKWDIPEIHYKDPGFTKYVGEKE